MGLSKLKTSAGLLQVSHIAAKIHVPPFANRANGVESAVLSNADS
jgi:hypothetical protein